MGIPLFAMVDTNSNPGNVDYVIPANDDATKSIEVVLDAICAAINEGLEERKVEKADADAAAAQAQAEAEPKKERRQRGRKKAAEEAPVENAE